MPFTPIHMGPGIVVKSLLRGSFSLMVFGWSQILMYVQPLVVILTGNGVLHGWTHSYLAALGIAGVAALTGKHLSEFGLRLLGITEKNAPVRIGWGIAFFSAFIGTFSHVFLDSFLYYEMKPFSPLLYNPFLGKVSALNIHLFCIVSGFVGGILYFLMVWSKREK